MQCYPPGIPARLPDTRPTRSRQTDFRGEVFTPLELTTRRVGDLTIIECAGSLLLGPEAEALRNAVRGILPNSPTILVDLAGVTMMDSAGIGTLVGLSYSARNAGARLILVRPTARIRALFQLTRLDATLEFEDMPERAATASGRKP